MGIVIRNILECSRISREAERKLGIWGESYFPEVADLRSLSK